jgi:glycosyltransferase involved in cell wall biosynthesis
VRLLASCGAAILLGAAGTAAAVPGEVFDLAAAGLALVSPCAGELERSIADHRAGVRYDGASGESLVRAVAMLAGDPRMLTVLRQGARRMAEVEFDRERTYSRFTAWIESLANENRGRDAGQAAPEPGAAE